MDLALRGKAALVTGGGRGIGRSIAGALAAEGVAVGICGRNAAQLDAAAEEIRAADAECVAVTADLCDPSDCSRAVAHVARTFGRLDVLVNNASAVVDAPPRGLEDIDDEHLSARFNGKFLPAARCCRDALPHLRASGAGRIIFIGGVSARTSTPLGTGAINGGQIVSGIGNAAIANFAKHLSDLVAGESVTVNVVHPGPTRTDRFAARVAANAVRSGVSRARAEADLSRPTGQMIEPEEIAALVVFLASPLAGAITGQAIAVDRGALGTIVY